uniref:Uncharacterized protein n=1 Tax=Cacopsylla melanoneura TaxID=428564 RepID=A0A8D9BRL3_9HEMI
MNARFCGVKRLPSALSCIEKKNLAKRKAKWWKSFCCHPHPPSIPSITKSSTTTFSTLSPKLLTNNLCTELFSHPSLSPPDNFRQLFVTPSPFYSSYSKTSFISPLIIG